MVFQTELRRQTFIPVKYFSDAHSRGLYKYTASLRRIEFVSILSFTYLANPYRAPARD